MPVETTRLDAGIYHNAWQGDVTVAELLDAKQIIIEMAADDELTQFVVILEGTEATKLPTDLRGLRSTVPEGVIEGVIYGMPRLGSLILRVFAPLSAVPFHLVRTREEAIERARTTLSESQT